MHLILEYLVDYCAFLWEGARYRIAGSQVALSFGGDALVTVESTALRMRFVSDRGQLFLDFQRPNTPASGEWYSTDLIWCLLTGTRQQTAVIDASTASFLRAHLLAIEALFGPENGDHTEQALRKLQRIRATELFG